MNARSEILQKIRALEIGKDSSFKEPDWEQDALKPFVGEQIEVFKEEIAALGSECFILESKADLPKALQEFCNNNGLKNVAGTSEKLAEMCGKDVGSLDETSIETLDGIVTFSESLIAQTGSVVMSSQLEGGRKSWAFPPVHIVVAMKKQIVPSIEGALSLLSRKYGDNIPSQITMVTGASRTADIEKTLVKGAHGPVKLVVFILKEDFN